MSNDQEHIPTEADIKLAKYFGQYLDGDTSKSSIEDPILQKLDVAKQTESELESKVLVQGQDAVWNSLSKKIDFTNTNPRKPIPLRSGNFYSLYRFAAAAVLILSLSLVLWLQFDSSGSDIIATRSSQVQTVSLSDGTTVILRPNSELAYQENSTSSISVILTGEAIFDVTSDPKRVFSVKTGNSRVVVTGTRFNVKSAQSQSSVYLLEGSVLFESLDASKSVVLSPGQASEVRQNGNPTDPYEFDEQTVIGWTQSRLMLANRPLVSVLEELELHFGVQIQIPDSLSNELLGGSISLESLEQTLQDLGIVLGGEFEVSELGDFKFKPDP